MEKTKTFTLSQTQNIYKWFNDFRKTRIKSLPIKTQWNLLQIIKLFESKVLDYQSFEENLMTDLQKEYTSTDKAIKEEEENNKVTWRIKDEFLDEFKEKISNMQNKELIPLLNEKYTYTFHAIDMNEILKNLQNDTLITLDDLEILDFINN